MGTSHRSYQERIDDLKAKQQKLKQMEKELLSRQLNDERKQRTQRHIRAGAEIEAALGHMITDEDMDRIREFLQRECTFQNSSDEKSFTDDLWGIEELDYSGEDDHFSKRF